MHRPQGRAYIPCVASRSCAVSGRCPCAAGRRQTDLASRPSGLQYYLTCVTQAVVSGGPVVRSCVHESWVVHNPGLPDTPPTCCPTAPRQSPYGYGTSHPNPFAARALLCVPLGPPGHGRTSGSLPTASQRSHSLPRARATSSVAPAFVRAGGRCMCVPSEGGGAVCHTPSAPRHASDASGWQ